MPVFRKFSLQQDGVDIPGPGLGKPEKEAAVFGKAVFPEVPGMVRQRLGISDRTP